MEMTLFLPTTVFVARRRTTTTVVAWDGTACVGFRVLWPLTLGERWQHPTSNVDNRTLLTGLTSRGAGVTGLGK